MIPKQNYLFSHMCDVKSGLDEVSTWASRTQNKKKTSVKKPSHNLWKNKQLKDLQVPGGYS